MAFRVNYNQQRGDRVRAKEQKKRERLARREEDSVKRKAGRDGMPEGADDAADAATVDAAKETS